MGAIRTLAALCATVLSVFPFATAAAESNFGYVDTIVQKAMAKAGTPAVSLAIVQQGKIVYEKAYGFRSLDPKLAATTATTFPIGSVSKQFLAATMVAMAREGKLSLDDPLSKYDPRIISPDFDAGAGRPPRPFAARLCAGNALAVQQWRLYDRGRDCAARRRSDAF